MNYEYKAPCKHSPLLPNSPLEAVRSLCHVGRGERQGIWGWLPQTQRRYPGNRGQQGESSAHLSGRLSSPDQQLAVLENNELVSAFEK